jgi:hypothetical protein
VEAERAAARQEQYDAFVRSIGGASETPDDSATQPPGLIDGAIQEGPDNWGSDEIGAGDDDTGLVKARYFRPFATPTMPPPPSGLRVGPSLDARGTAPIGAPASGFFGQHDYSTALGGYYTDLPSPLNIITSTPAGWWDIGDGRRVQSDEVERIYAEQKRRLKEQDSAEPAAGVRVVDKWKDGQVPRESQVQARERELDPTCHPNGGWERDPNFKNYSDRTKRYETQVTHAPGLDYVVRRPGQRPVKFDGCAVWDPRRPLLEAKGPGYAPLLPKAQQWGFYENVFDGAVNQANRQADAGPDQRIEWHIAEPGAYGFFEEATQPRRPPIVLRQEPAQ